MDITKYSMNDPLMYKIKVVFILFLGKDSFFGTFFFRNKTSLEIGTSSIRSTTGFTRLALLDKGP